MEFSIDAQELGLGFAFRSKFRRHYSEDCKPMLVFTSIFLDGICRKSFEAELFQ